MPIFRPLLLLRLLFATPAVVPAPSSAPSAPKQASPSPSTPSTPKAAAAPKASAATGAKPSAASSARPLPGDPSPAAVLARVQQVYDGVKDLHARFDQVLSSQIGGDKRASGEVWLKKPGKMRWEYVKPEKKQMISDGKTLWVYEPEDQQAFKQELRSSTVPLSVSFLAGQGKLSEEFDATIVRPPGIGKEGEVVLRLVPRTATAAYRHLLFVVEVQSGLVRQIHVHDQQGGVNRLTFSQIETNRGADEARFRFTPPAGTRVLSGAPR